MCQGVKEVAHEAASFALDDFVDADKIVKAVVSKMETVQTVTICYALPIQSQLNPNLIPIRNIDSCIYSSDSPETSRQAILHFLKLCRLARLFRDSKILSPSWKKTHVHKQYMCAVFINKPVQRNCKAVQPIICIRGHQL